MRFRRIYFWPLLFILITKSSAEDQWNVSNNLNPRFYIVSSGSSYQRLMYNDGQNNTSQIAWNNDNDWGIVSETIQLDDGTAFAFYTKNNEIKGIWKDVNDPVFYNATLEDGGYSSSSILPSSRKQISLLYTGGREVELAIIGEYSKELTYYMATIGSKSHWIFKTKEHIAGRRTPPISGGGYWTDNPVYLFHNNGIPHIYFQDETNDRILLAKKQSNAWNIEPIVSGTYNNIIPDQGYILAEKYPSIEILIERDNIWNGIIIQSQSSNYKSLKGFALLNDTIYVVKASNTEIQLLEYGNSGWLESIVYSGTLSATYLTDNAKLSIVDSKLTIDYDGIRFQRESIDNSTKSLLAVSSVDSDNDTIVDFEEFFSHNTDRYAPDTDGDGANDGLEITNGFNPLDSNSYPPPIPAITSNPSSTVLDAGESAVLSVTASGTGLTYLWKKDGQNIANSNSTSLVINSVTLSDSGDYTVTVSNSSGSVTSGVANISVRTQLETWKMSYFTGSDLSEDEISGNSGDPDSDGLSNLLEFALNQDPTVSNTIWYDDMNMQNVDGSQHLVVSYGKRINDMSISLVLEESLSLNSDDWSPVTSAPQLLSSDATSEVWQHLLSVDSHGSKCFFRLRAVE